MLDGAWNGRRCSYATTREQIKTRSARDRWPGKAVESQARSSAVPNVTNKGKSNVLEVITGRSNRCDREDRWRCTRTRQTAAQGRQCRCRKDASLHTGCVAGAGMTSLGRGTRGPTGPPGPPLQAGNDKASAMIGRFMPLMRGARGHLRPRIWDS